MRFAAAIMCALSTGLGCGTDDATGVPGDGATSTGDEVMTTLPVTVSASTDPSISASESSTPTSSSTGDEPTSSTGEIASTGSTGGPDPTTSGGTGSTSGGADFVVEWCILQFPAQIIEAANVETTVYGRVYVEGITDETEFVDAHPQLVSEFGYGDDGSDPDGGGWTWFEGEGNPGWDGTMAGGVGSENNDEYQYDLAFPANGTYDYAARFSADGGTTWAYCDLDDLQTGGYTPDQAGDAQIG